MEVGLVCRFNNTQSTSHPVRAEPFAKPFLAISVFSCH